MKANEFLNLMGEIDGDLIVNAKKVPAPRRSPAWRKMLIIAAAACLLVGVLTVMILISMREGPDVPPIGTNQESTSEKQEETTTQDPVIVDGAFVESLSVWQYGSSEASGLPTDHKNNFSWNDYDYQDKSVIQNLKVNMQGTEYELTYKESSDGPLYRDTVHKYSDGTVEQWFSAGSGKCIFFSDLRIKEYDDTKIVSLEKQQELAYEFLENQVINPEQFQIVREENISGILIVWFVRTNNSVETYERVFVWVDQIGEVCRYKLEHVNEMSNVQSIPDEIIQNAYAALENEVQSIYRQLTEKEDYEMTYKAEIDKLVRLDDGRLAFDCHVNVKVKTPEGETLSEGAWFIIPITEPTVQAE